jgi:hypothetical protein
MKKKQVVTYVLLGAGGLVIALAVTLLVRGVSQYRQKEEQFKRLRSQLTGLYASEVFPSAANTNLERDNRRQLEHWYRDVIQQLAKGNITSDERSPSQFIGRLDRARQDMKVSAERGRVRLPEGNTVFAFGFERYAGTGQLPAPDHVPRLMEQLIMVRLLTRLMIESEVTAITSIQREVFEERASDLSQSASSGDFGGQSSQASTMRTRGSRGQGGAAVAEGVSASGSLPSSSASKMFSTYRFVLEFNAKEEALCKLLNALASSRLYTVVRTVRVRKDVPDMLPSRTGGPSGAAPASDESLAFLFGGGAPATAAQPASAQTGGPSLGPSNPVSGIEMETPMQVRLEIDVYKFRSADENTN